MPKKGCGLIMKDGSALLITMLLTAVVAALTVAAIRLVSHEHLFSVQSANWNQTLHTAEAGIEIALAAFQQQVNSADGFSAWSQSGDTYSLPFTDLAPAGHTAPNTAFTISVNTNTLTVQATGRMPEPRTGDMISRTVQVTVQPDNWWPFEHSLLGRGQITLTGNAVLDSFKSDDPTASTDGQYDPAKARDNASVGSMGEFLASIDAGGNGGLEGDFFVSEDGSVTIGGSYAQNGLIHNDLDVDIPSVNEEFPMLSSPALGNGDVVNVAGTTILSVPSITVNGNKTLTVTGSGVAKIYVSGNSQFTGSSSLQVIANPTNASLKVKFYCDGNIFLNNVANQPGNAADLSFWGTENCSSVHFTGNDDFIGTIYAPDADVELTGNGGIMGSIVGSTIFSRGTADFHYDESLATNGSPMLVGYDITSWKEL